jgi:hypothetical protein
MMTDSDSDCTVNDILDEQMVSLIAASAAAANSSAFFDEDEMTNGDQRFVDPEEEVRDQLSLLIKNPSLFKVMTNFTALDLEELSAKVCPILSTGQPRGIFGGMSKFSNQQRLLHLLLYMKHDNTVVFGEDGWNWSKSSACDDAVL